MIYSGRNNFKCHDEKFQGGNLGFLLTKFVNMNSNRVELHLHKMYKASTAPRSF